MKCSIVKVKIHVLVEQMLPMYKHHIATEKPPNHAPRERVFRADGQSVQRLAGRGKRLSAGRGLYAHRGHDVFRDLGGRRHRHVRFQRRRRRRFPDDSDKYERRKAESPREGRVHLPGMGTGRNIL